MTLSNRKAQRRKQRGWSIIELGIVLIIIGVVAAVAAPLLGGFVRAGKLEALEQEMLAMADSLDAYALGIGAPPAKTVRVSLGVTGPALGLGNGTLLGVPKAQVGLSGFNGRNPYGDPYTAQLKAFGPGGKEHIIEVATCIDQKFSDSGSSNTFIGLSCTPPPPQCGGMCLVMYSRIVVPSRELGDIEAENELVYGNIPAPPQPPPPPPPGKCAASDTPIATPVGPTSIAELRVGDMVYTEHAGTIVARPIIRVGSVAVFEHTMVGLRLDDGRVVSMSPDHPTADGRIFSDVRVGDWLGERLVTRVERTVYEDLRTYDILPDSDSGTYVAAGALVGSTLR